MPQLNKGCKWVFGWAVVGKDRKIRIPPAAFGEYGFQSGGVMFFSYGNHISGGFGLGKQEIILENQRIQKRIQTQASLEENMLVLLPSEIDVQPCEHLLVVRESSIALGFLLSGPIFNEALYHPEIEIFFP